LGRTKDGETIDKVQTEFTTKQNYTVCIVPSIPHASHDISLGNEATAFVVQSEADNLAGVRSAVNSASLNRISTSLLQYPNLTFHSLRPFPASHFGFTVL